MITNEQIQGLKNIVEYCGVGCCLGSEHMAYIKAAIDTLERLPIYADTGARFVPEVDECWHIIRFPRFPDDISFARNNPSFDGNSWVVPVYDGESWDGKFYSSEAAAIAKQRKDGE